jgi:hypothetical protein
LSLALLGTEEKATERATLIVIRDLFMTRLDLSDVELPTVGVHVRTKTRRRLADYRYEPKARS